jgi:hypothetical protein
MWTMDEFKKDRDKQILAFGIVFFLLAFPLYFNTTSGDVSGSTFGGMDFYEVSGDMTYVELDSGMEYVASGDTWTIDDLSTDSIDGADDMNIVGVLVTLSYGEDETTSGPCIPGTAGQAAADTIGGTVMHGAYNASASGTNENPSHTVESLWFNDSMVDSILFLSESEIIEGVDADGAGLGAYSLDITVDAEAGNTAGNALNPCDREDNGEEVSYKIELIVYDYTITSVLEPLFE